MTDILSSIFFPLEKQFACICTPPVVYHDQALQEFLCGEDHCQKFINQDLTFLQPSEVQCQAIRLPQLNEQHRLSTEEITPVSTAEATNYIRGRVSAIDTTYDRRRSTNPTAPIQTVEPVIGFMPEENKKAKEDPKLMVKELLGLTSCKGYVETHLKTLDGTYVNQPNRFLPLAKEAKKLAGALKEEQQASQWSGIPPEKLVQESLIEQLNSIQILEQLAPLHAAHEHLP